MNYELYRRSAPGQALTDALDELIQNQQITPQLAMRVLSQFDRVMAESLSMERRRCNVKVGRGMISTASSGCLLWMQGHLKNYRYLDDVWTFEVTNAEVRFDDETVMSKHLKIVACNARRAENATAKDTK